MVPGTARRRPPTRRTSDAGHRRSLPIQRPGITIYATAAEQIRRAHRQFCGREPDAHQSVSTGICGAPECHARMNEKVGTELIARRRKEYAERIKETLALAEAEVGAALEFLAVPRERASLAVVPWQDRPVEPLPCGRRADTCNAFHCTAVRHLYCDWHDRGATAVAIVAFGEDGPDGAPPAKALSVFRAEGGWRPLPDAGELAEDVPES